jgi:cation transport regulator ChaC
MQTHRSWLWYFAYGSNLDPRTFLGRRGMRPRDAQLAILVDFRLTFDLPVGPGERGVANLLPAPGDDVHGVAYEISPAQAVHLDRSEGAPRSYRRTDVELCTPGGEQLRGFTYVSSHRAEGRKPSSRYMGLLLRGAQHHGLPRAYLARLREIELAVDERNPQLELFPRDET